MTKVRRGTCGRGEGRGNTNDSDASLSHGVVWSNPLIEMLLSMYQFCDYHDFHNESLFIMIKNKYSNYEFL